MTFLQTGISLENAPLEVLERVAVTGSDLAGWAGEISRLLGGDGRATILSTCNRTELYAHLDDAGTGIEVMVEFLQLLADRSPGAVRIDVAPYAMNRTGEECVRHLFSVASGLDSLVVGDGQVGSQVRAALHAASDSDSEVDHGLSRMFHAALRTGRHVRKTIGNSVTDSTVPHAGVALLEARVRGGLRDAAAAVIGAGETARLAASEMQRRGVSNLMVTSRNHENAVKFADAVGGEAFRMSSLDDALAKSDVALACTASPTPVVDLPTVLRATERRGSGMAPLHIMDLGVPRDVESAIGSLAGVRLLTIEDLRDAYADQREADAVRSSQAQVVVDEAAARFVRDWNTQDHMREMGSHATLVRKREVERTLGSLSHLTPEDREAIDAMARSIVKGVLAGPIRRIRDDDR